MIHFRNEKTGEEVYSSTKEGYDREHGWRLVNAKARRPREKVDDETKRRANIEAMGSVGRYDDLLKRIEALEVRVGVLDDPLAR